MTKFTKLHFGSARRGVRGSMPKGWKIEHLTKGRKIMSIIGLFAIFILIVLGVPIVEKYHFDRFYSWIVLLSVVCSIGIMVYGSVSWRIK